MQNYTLYNFDHGFEKEKTFKIGKYLIEVNDKQAENICKLEQNATRSLITDFDLSRKVEEIEYQSGEIVETATLKVSKGDITSSVIYKELPERSSIDDFVLFLSFITGRRVYLEDELEHEVSKKYFHSIVNNNFFSFASVNLDEGFSKLEELKLDVPFYNLIHSKTIQDLPTICFYVNTVINVLFDKWNKENGKSKYSTNLNVEEIKEQIVNRLEKSLIDKVKLWVNSALSEKSYNKATIADVVARININNQPSALYKLQNFLVGMALFPVESNKEHHKRLKWINTVRNIMIHKGDISSDKSFSYQQKLEITMSITFILIGIAEYYFAKEIFNIDNYLIEQNADEIREYFESGIYRGQKVFDETYEQFVERQEIEWIENGRYL